MKNMNKKQRILYSTIIVFAAIMTILAILFGVKWKQTKDTLSTFQSEITLNFDMDNDKKIDYSFTFKGTYGGVTLDQILEDDMPSDSPLHFDISQGMLKSISSPKKGVISQDGSHYWSIYSSTSANVNKYYDDKSGWGFDTPYDWNPTKKYNEQTIKEFHTTVGMAGLAMGPTNEFTFSFIPYSM